LQAGLLTTVGISKIEPMVDGLQSMPMMFDSLDEVDYIGEILQPELERSLEEKGFVVLFWTDTGWIRFFSSKPVVYPDDLRALKIWSWAGNPAQVDIYKKSGFNTVPLETKDIVLSFQTKAVSAIPMPTTPAMASQLDQLAPHMLNLNWAPLIGAAIVDKDVWEKISARDRRIMKEAAAKAGRAMKADARKEASDSVEAMVQRGLTVHEVTPEIEVKWREAAESAYPEIRGRLVPEEVVDRVQMLLKEYRSRKNPTP
jgi:TRAP-type C4-dicarboxylate transport system substrate-binding protein